MILSRCLEPTLVLMSVYVGISWALSYILGPSGFSIVVQLYAVWYACSAYTIWCFGEWPYGSDSPLSPRSWPYPWLACHSQVDFKVSRDQRRIVERVDEAVVYAYYPHGLLPVGLVLGFLFHGRLPRFADRVVISWAFFLLPLVREICMWSGAVPPVNAAIRRHLAARRSVAISPEGVDGVLAFAGHKVNLAFGSHGRPGSRGILHIAWNLGIPVVPVVGDGDERVFSIQPFTAATALLEFLVKHTGYCFPLFGSGPFYTPVCAHIGEPIEYRSKEAFALYENRFYKQLANLFEEHIPRDRRAPGLEQWLCTMKN